MTSCIATGWPPTSQGYWTKHVTIASLCYHSLPGSKNSSCDIENRSLSAAPVSTQEIEGLSALYRDLRQQGDRRGIREERASPFVLLVSFSPDKLSQEVPFSQQFSKKNALDCVQGLSRSPVRRQAGEEEAGLPKKPGVPILALPTV